MKDIPVTSRNFGGRRIGKVTEIKETENGLEMTFDIDLDSLTEEERDAIFWKPRGLSIHRDEEE